MTDAKITKPKHCVIGFGIPTSEEGWFRSSQQLSEPRYAKSKNVMFTEYEVQFLRPLAKFVWRVRLLGVRVVEVLTLEGFSECFHVGSTSAVVLFSHWAGSGQGSDTSEKGHGGACLVEFADRMATPAKVVAQVPRKFAGHIDVCTCHPPELIRLLRKQRPDCTISFIDKKVKPDRWLDFYYDLFRLLRDKELNYIHAQDKIARYWLAQLVVIQAATRKVHHDRYQPDQN